MFAEVLKNFVRAAEVRPVLPRFAEVQMSTEVRYGWPGLAKFRSASLRVAKLSEVRKGSLK